MNGGYVLIDSTGLNLNTDETQTVNGLYSKAKSATKLNKPVYCVNAVFGEYGKITPIPVMCNYLSDGKTICCTSATLQVIISENDSVVINNMGVTE